MLAYDPNGTIYEGKLVLLKGTCVDEVDELTDGAFDAHGVAKRFHMNANGTIDEGQVALLHGKYGDKVNGLAEGDLATQHLLTK